MDLTLRDVTRVVGSAVKTVADVAVDKAREMAEEYGERGLSTGAYRGREGHQGPPKIESGYYSTGRMVGFGSDSMPRSGSGGYGNDSHSSAAGYGGGYRGGGASKWAEEERQLRERRLAARTGYANRDAYDRDEFDERDDHGDTDRFDGYSSRSAYDHGKEDELSRRAASSGGYAVPGAPTYTTQRQEHNRQQAPSQSHVPRIESGYYSSGRMEGFGSDDVRGRGGYDRGRGGAGGGGGGYANRAAYDRDERSDRMGALLEMSQQTVAAVSTAFQERVSEAVRGPETGGFGGGTTSGLLESNGAKQPARSEDWRHGHGDDDGHGADAWTSTIEFEPDGTQRVVQEGDVRSAGGERPRGVPPSLPRPNVPKPSLPSQPRLAVGGEWARQSERVSGASVQMPSRPRPSRALPSRPDGRPRPTSGVPSNFGPTSFGGGGADGNDDAQAQTPAAEANLLSLEDEAQAVDDPFSGGSFAVNDPFASGAAAADDPFASSSSPANDPFAAANDPFAPSNGFGDSVPFPVAAPDDPFGPSASVAAAPPPARSLQLDAPTLISDGISDGGAGGPALLDSPADLGRGGSNAELFALASPSDLTKCAARAADVAGQSDLAMLGALDLGSSPAHPPVPVPVASANGGGGSFAGGSEAEAVASAAAVVPDLSDSGGGGGASHSAEAGAGMKSKDPWAMAMGGGVIDLENISKPKGGEKAAAKPSVSMGQMKPSTVASAPGGGMGMGGACGMGMGGGMSVGVGGGGLGGGAMGGGIGSMGAGMGMPGQMAGGGTAGVMGMGPMGGGGAMSMGMNPMGGTVGMGGAMGGGMGVGVCVAACSATGASPASGGAKFCIECGTKLSGGKFCPNCGAKL